MKKFEIKTNVHPNTDGSPWGWIIIIEGSRIRVAMWSGKEERKLCEELCKSHNSQFSIGGEEAFEKWYKNGGMKFAAAMKEKYVKEIFMAGISYSAEGIRQGEFLVKEVKGKDLKEGDIYWNGIEWNDIVNKSDYACKERMDDTFLVRIIPEPPK